MPPDDNGWSEWSRFVLKELERLNKNYEKMRIEMSLLRTEIATLKVRAGLWGTVGAAIPVVIMLAIQFFNS